jgi:hypothetical protein
MKLDRRWWVAIGVAAVAIVALVLSETVFHKKPQECGPVQEFLDYNHSQSEQIAAKTADESGLPTATDEIIYRAWADGLAERAQRVTDPDLARTASQVSNLANQFVNKLSTVRIQANARAPGAPAPPVVYEMDALNKQISQKLQELSDACAE